MMDTTDVGLGPNPDLRSADLLQRVTVSTVWLLSVSVCGLTKFCFVIFILYLWKHEINIILTLKTFVKFTPEWGVCPPPIQGSAVNHF